MVLSQREIATRTSILVSAPHNSTAQGFVRPQSLPRAPRGCEDDWTPICSAMRDQGHALPASQILACAVPYQSLSRFSSHISRQSRRFSLMTAMESPRNLLGRNQKQKRISWMRLGFQRHVREKRSVAVNSLPVHHRFAALIALSSTHPAGSSQSASGTLHWVPGPTTSTDPEWNSATKRRWVGDSITASNELLLTQPLKPNPVGQRHCVRRSSLAARRLCRSAKKKEGQSTAVHGTD